MDIVLQCLSPLPCRLQMCPTVSTTHLALASMSQHNKVRCIAMRRHPLHINGMTRWMRTHLIDVSHCPIYHLPPPDVELQHPPRLHWPWTLRNVPTTCSPDSMSRRTNVQHLSMCSQMVITKRTPRTCLYDVCLHPTCAPRPMDVILQHLVLLHQL